MPRHPEFYLAEGSSSVGFDCIIVVQRNDSIRITIWNLIACFLTSLPLSNACASLIRSGNCLMKLLNGENSKSLSIFLRELFKKNSHTHGLFQWTIVVKNLNESNVIITKQHIIFASIFQ